MLCITASPNDKVFISKRGSLSFVASGEQRQRLSYNDGHE